METENRQPGHLCAILNMLGGFRAALFLRKDFRSPLPGFRTIREENPGFAPCLFDNFRLKSILPPQKIISGEKNRYGSELPLEKAL